VGRIKSYIKGHPGRTFISLLAALVLLLMALGCGSRGTGEGGEAGNRNLLAGLKPQKSRLVRCAACVTNGVIAPDGGNWQSEGTAEFRSTEAVVEYDLGQVQQIRAAWLQGDNNDTYHLTGSVDGVAFETLWNAGPVRQTGLQERVNKSLDASARYVRVMASGGDGNYSLTEVQLFANPPAALPAGVQVARGIPKVIEVRSKVLAFGLALVGLLVLSYRKAPWWWLGLVSLVPLTVGWELASMLIDTWPQEQRQVSLVRATTAVVAGVALLRELWAPARFPAHRAVVLGVLGLCGVVGFLAFYNLGAPQFRDNDLGKTTYVHHLDLRQYYPTAKYFPELGYRSMYEADVAAYLEDHPDESIASIEKRPLRKLSDLQMSTVGGQRERIQSARGLFSPERWEEYKADARYFRLAMGESGYFSTFHDMGGNATPVWVGFAHILFNQLPASDANFAWTALLDVLMILGAFALVGWAFGPRTAFLCMVIFGANDFIMYGSNWGGATLRHDWMAYLAFGACALKRHRFGWAGVLLALATSMRAFPALALVCLSFPLAWWFLEYVKLHRRLPTQGEIWRSQRPVFVVAFSAALTLGVLFIASSLTLGVEAWGDWYVKVGQLSGDPHGNHISLRSLIAGWDGDQGLVLADRKPMFLLAVVFYVGAVFAACRGQRHEQTAMLGLVLTPVLFYPANYYIHLVWLLPLVMVERRKFDTPLAAPFDPAHTWVGLLLVGMCAAQYFTTFETDRGLHFYMATVLLFATMTFMLVTLVRRNAAVAVVGELAEPSESKSASGPRSAAKSARPADSGQDAAQ